MLQAGVVEYGESFLSRFQPVLDSVIHGGIISTCICHCTPTTIPVPGNPAAPLASLYADWYYGRTKGGSASVYVTDPMLGGKGVGWRWGQVAASNLTTLRAVDRMQVHRPPWAKRERHHAHQNAPEGAAPRAVLLLPWAVNAFACHMRPMRFGVSTFELNETS